MAQNPAPGYDFGGHLETIYPQSNNQTLNPKLTVHRRLQPDSPYISQEFLNTDGSIRGYSGGFPPAGDVDKNGLLTLADWVEFRVAFNSQNPTQDQINTHDFIEQWNTIDSADSNKFMEGYLNSNGSFPDCNENALNDLEEILDTDELGLPDLDVDNDGILDSCCSTGIYSTSSPNQNLDGVESMRYLSFVAGTNPGQQTALRVQTGLNEATYQYVQEPHPVSQASGSSDDSGTTFLHSTLGCEPFHTDWSQYTEPIYVSGREISPNRAFDIQAVDQICGTALEGNFSAPYTIATSQWGDLTNACDPLGCGAPNGSSDFGDISAVVDKFRNLPVSPHKASADVAPEIPDLKVDFTDIPAVVDGFRGLPYSYATSGGC